MVDTKKISLCITTWNRDRMTVNAYSRVVDDDRIAEVVIVDDKSDPKYQQSLKNLITHPNVKLIVNNENLGCYRNKHRAICHATSDYVIILDSDNVIDKSYIDAIYGCDWSPDTILAPDFARPHFNYHLFSGKTIDRYNVKDFIPTASATRFDCLINCMNYFVNREEYLKVWDGRIEPWTADTIYQNYQWFRAGNKMYVVPGMQYDHDIHEHVNGQEGSHYKKFVQNTGNFYKEVEKKLMRL